MNMVFKAMLLKNIVAYFKHAINMITLNNCNIMESGACVNKEKLAIEFRTNNVFVCIIHWAGLGRA